MSTPPRRKPGPPTELWIYRYDPTATNRGGRRDLVFNAAPEPGVERAVYRLFGAGRYRLEWRDERRWLVKVKVVDARASGVVVSPKKQVSVRNVPPPAALPRHPVREPPLIEREGDGPAVTNNPPSWSLIGPPSDLRDSAAVVRWLQHVANKMNEVLVEVQRDLNVAEKRSSVGKTDLVRFRGVVDRVRRELGEFVARGPEFGARARTREGAEEVHSWAAPTIERLRKVQREIGGSRGR